VSELSRRTFLSGAAAAAALSACSPSTPTSSATTSSTAGAPGSSAAAGTTAPTLPDPAKAPFDTVVVLMMENRSFDHLLGWLPGANGKQTGLSYADQTGAAQASWPLGTDGQGCAYRDPAHDWESIAKQYNAGKVDGWLQTAPVGDHFPIGYYTAEHVPVLGALAQNYTTFDNYFCSVQAATWPNRFYQLCATTDVDQSGFFPTEVAKRPSKIELSIFDRLRDKGLTGGYYYWSEPMSLLFQSQKYDDISYKQEQFFTDAKAGKLPNVTFIDPDYGSIAEFLGVSNDYHPHGNIQSGEGYVADVYNALKASPQWDRMVFVLNFDEHGGFYDHVVPPTCIDDTDPGAPGMRPDFKRLGFRVPAIAMGPFAPKKIDSSGPYEHCSILKMIEWRWDLEPMTARDANAKNLADALDFSTTRPAFDLAPFTAPPLAQCPPAAPA